MPHIVIFCIINLTVDKKKHIKMLRKGDNYMQNHAMNKKQKNSHQNQKNNHDNPKNVVQANKENFNARSLFEQDAGGKNKHGQDSNFGSVVVSPTFQSNKVDLKDDLFKQNQGYLEVNLSLRDMNKGVNQSFQKKGELQRKIQDAHLKENRSSEEERVRLIEHYKSKKYWTKLEKFFQQDSVTAVDALLAWQDSIGKYKVVKEKEEKTCQENIALRDEISKRDDKIMELEKQMALDRNQTRVLSQKKCKNCQFLLQEKEKEHFQLEKVSKKLLKDLKQKDENLMEVKKSLKKMEDKYHQQKFLREQIEKKVSLLKQDLDKKNTKLNEKEQIEKQFEKELGKLQTEERQASKLYIECEQQKELRYQVQKNMAKMQQKYKKQISELSQSCTELLEQKNIQQDKAKKIKQQYNDMKSSYRRLQSEFESIEEKLKQTQNDSEQRLKKFKEEKAKRIDYEQKLTKATKLYEESENTRNKLEFQLIHEKKIVEDKDEEIGKYQDTIRELENRCKQYDSNESRGRDNTFFNVTKNKNPHNHHHSSSQNLNFNPKIYIKVKEIYHEIKQISEESSIDSVPRRRFRDEIDDRDHPNNFQFQKYINQIHTDFSNIINKYYYISKENEILKDKLDNIEDEKEGELKQIKKALNIKEQTLRSILAFIPEDLKDAVIDLLQISQNIINNQDVDLSELEEFNEVREAIEKEGKEWRQNYQSMKFKYKQLEDELHSLLQKDSMKRRRGQQIRTEYDYNRQVISKKDIKRKYNFDS